MLRRLVLGLTLAATVSTFAAPPPAQAQSAPASPTASPRPIPRTPDAVTHHTISLGGKTIGYTARAGTLLLRDGDERPTASVFYVAYTADNATPRKRPVTFFWNGGPGSSTIWLHMGSFGPVRVAVPSNGAQPGPNVPLVENESSLLDTSDLVFVDAVGTGWSVPVGRATGSDFWGIDEDAKAFDQFVRRWVTKSGRWESPKYLFGESYGTTRAANVVNLLQQDGMAINGVVLLSSALSYNILPIGQGPGEDLAYIGYLPTEAAVAWFHRKLPSRPPNLDRFLAEVRAFAGGPYAAALRRGDTLDAGTRAQIVAKLHAYTGLDASYIEASNLRIGPSRFENQLLRSQGLIVGRLDARYTAAETDKNAAFPSFDPSDTMSAAAYVATFNHYLHDVLHYTEQRPYDVLDYNVNRNWKYQRGEDSNAPTVVADLKTAIAQNPSLHILSANGYYDLATGFYATEYLLNHMGLTPAQQRQITYSYYESGHQVYMNHASLVQFKRDLTGFYRDSAR
jgi:carboxypeptidase C (cathepsin A)